MAGHTPQKYADPALRMLDPRFRDIAPSRGDMGASELFVDQGILDQHGVQLKAIDTERRQVTALVSDASPDRYQEVVKPSAFQKWLPHFMRNPIFLADHDPSKPIGSWVKMQVKEFGLVGTAQYADTALAEERWQLYRARHMRAFSVAWITHKYEMERLDFEDGENRLTRVFTEVELVEVSSVGIGANRNALVRAAAAHHRTNNADWSGASDVHGDDRATAVRALERAVRSRHAEIETGATRRLVKALDAAGF